MREIKFRVWSEDYGGMLPSDELTFKYDGGGITNVTSNLRTATASSSDFILEQYTGLKDKNGVEIYENDELAPYNAQVVWNDKLACWCGRHKNDTDIWPLYTDDIKNLEVVGNIHNVVE